MSLSRLCRASILLAAMLLGPPLWAKPPVHAAAPSDAGRLNDRAELARIVSFYEAGKYGECADALHSLLSADSPRPLHEPDVVESARIYHAACLIGSGQTELADEPLRAAIRQNPQMKPPDSLVFPPQVVDRFLRVRETMFDVIRKAEDERVKRAQELALQQEERSRQERIRVARLERLAQEETVVVPKSRWIALVPFGVGQFQNGEKPLGYMFLSSELLLAASTLTELGIYSYLELEASRVEKPDPSIRGKLTDWHTALAITSYSWIAASALGVLEAQLSFVPEQRQTRKRPLPPELRPQASSLRVVPSAVAVPGGAVLGVSGRF